MDNQEIKKEIKETSPAARKHNVNVYNVQGFVNGFVLQWQGDIGFGEYTIHIDDDGKWHGDSECMDRGEDKSFLKQLFDDILAQIEVE